MKLLDKLARWWNAPCVEVLRRRWGSNVNPPPAHARPPVPPMAYRRFPAPDLDPKMTEAAVRTLLSLRYEWAGGAFWRPPLGLMPSWLTEPHQQCFRLNAERSVAVATDYFWNEDMADCPRGVKVQLLGMGGVAVYGNYSGSDFWTAWAPCPKRR